MNIDYLKLLIYESYDNGEITYGEKEYLLEKIEYIYEDKIKADFLQGISDIKKGNEFFADSIDLRKVDVIRNKLKRGDITKAEFDKKYKEIVDAAISKGRAGSAKRLTPLGTDEYEISKNRPNTEKPINHNSFKKDSNNLVDHISINASNKAEYDKIKHHYDICHTTQDYREYKDHYKRLCNILGADPEKDTVMGLVPVERNQKTGKLEKRTTLTAGIAHGDSKVISPPVDKKSKNNNKVTHVSSTKNITELKPTFRSNDALSLYPRKRVYVGVNTDPSKFINNGGENPTIYKIKDTHGKNIKLDTEYNLRDIKAGYIETDKKIPIETMDDKLKNNKSNNKSNMNLRKAALIGAGIAGTAGAAYIIKKKLDAKKKKKKEEEAKKAMKESTFDYLLESIQAYKEDVNLKKITKDVTDKVMNSKVGKAVGKGTDMMNDNINKTSMNIANIVPDNNRKNHKLRNRLAYASKLAQTGLAAGAVTAAPITQVGNAVVLGSMNKSMEDSNHPLDRLAIKKRKELIDKMNTNIEKNKETVNKVNKDKSELGMALKHASLPNFNVLGEDTEDIEYLSEEDNSMLDAALAHPKIKLRNALSKGTNNTLNKANQALYKKIPNTPKTHKLRNRLAVAAKLTGTVGAVGAYKVSPLPGTDFYALGLANEIKNSKNPVDRVITKNASDLKKKANNTIENEKKILNKANKDKSELGMALKHASLPNFNVLGEDTEED